MCACGLGCALLLEQNLVVGVHGLMHLWVHRLELSLPKCTCALDTTLCVGQQICWTNLCEAHAKRLVHSRPVDVHVTNQHASLTPALGSFLSVFFFFPIFFHALHALTSGIRAQSCLMIPKFARLCRELHALGAENFALGCCSVMVLQSLQQCGVQIDKPLGICQYDVQQEVSRKRSKVSLRVKCLLNLPQVPACCCSLQWPHSSLR